MLKIALAALTALAIVGTVALPASGSAPGPIGTDIGTFEAVCSYSHRLADDPIVSPRSPGASHKHDFFGARTTDAFSTHESIRASATSCVRYDTPASDVDHSAYWAPTLYVNGKPVVATTLGAYYNAGVRYVESVEPFPANLRMIVGSSAGGPMEIDGERVWSYLCPGGDSIAATALTAPTCQTRVMDLVLRFPDCWDGVNLDSPDHKSHMAYSRRETSAALRTCPPTHPRLVPKLGLTLRYPTKGGSTVKLASGGISSAHADFMNGWDQSKLEALVSDCLVADRYCGGGDVPVAGH